MALLVDRPYVNLEGRIERVEPKEWARPLFRDVAALVGDHGCPKGPRALTISPPLRG